MLGNMIISAIRTAVPLIAGWLLSLTIATPILAAFGVDSKRASEVVASVVTVALAYAYFLIVRALEEKFPQLGVFLGVPAKPTYSVSGFTGTVIDMGTGSIDPGEDTGAPAGPVPPYSPEHAAN